MQLPSYSRALRREPSSDIISGGRKMKKDPLLFVLVIAVGVFSYFAAFKGMVLICMIPLLIVLTALWYVATSVVTRKMVEKSRKGESFFFQRGGLINKDETELVNGALVATKSEIIFYKRKGYFGGIVPIWSAFTSTIESYSMEKVDDKHDGIIFTISGDDDKIKVASSHLKKREEEFRSSIGW